MIQSGCTKVAWSHKTIFHVETSRVSVLWIDMAAKAWLTGDTVHQDLPAWELLLQLPDLPLLVPICNHQLYTENRDRINKSQGQKRMGRKSKNKQARLIKEGMNSVMRNSPCSSTSSLLSLIWTNPVSITMFKKKKDLAKDKVHLRWK